MWVWVFNITRWCLTISQSLFFLCSSSFLFWPSCFYWECSFNSVVCRANLMGTDGFHGGKGGIWFLNFQQCELMGTWNCPWETRCKGQGDLGKWARRPTLWLHGGRDGERTGELAGCNSWEQGEAPTTTSFQIYPYKKPFHRTYQRAETSVLIMNSWRKCTGNVNL